VMMMKVCFSAKQVDEDDGRSATILVRFRDFVLLVVGRSGRTRTDQMTSPNSSGPPATTRKHVPRETIFKKSK